MRILTVSLFGHRYIDSLVELENRLKPMIKKLLEEEEYVSFLIGRYGEFDEYTASVIKRVQKEYRSDNSDITLFLPYPLSNIEYYEGYYDRIVIPQEVHRVHPKSAITHINRLMIDQSELVIVYVERNKGGAYTAMKYAEKTKKPIINLFNLKL